MHVTRTLTGAVAPACFGPGGAGALSGTLIPAYAGAAEGAATPLGRVLARRRDVRHQRHRGVRLGCSRASRLRRRLAVVKADVGRIDGVFDATCGAW